MDVTINSEEGTHLLIACGDRFAVIERRNNRLYNCHDGKRDGIPLDNLPAIWKILDERDWTDKATAQAAFNEVVARWTQLAQRML
jgi:hypothetical protein